MEEGFGAVEAFDFAAAVVPAFGAAVFAVGGGGLQSLVNDCGGVAKQIGDGGVAAFDADGDVAGGVDIEKRPPRAAPWDARAMEILVERYA